MMKLTAQAEAFKQQIKAALVNAVMPASESAIIILLMIAAHESGGFRFVKQNGGPALGFFQMEPFTFYDCIDWLKHLGRFPRVCRKSSHHRLVFDVAYSVELARVKLWRDSKALPEADDLPALAQYAKRVWNSEAGKAEAQDYLNAFKKYGLGEV